MVDPSNFREKTSPAAKAGELASGPAATVTSVDVTRRFAPGTLVAGRYRVAGIAGVGGMGVVYRARDEELGVETALKVLRPDLGSDPAVVERFRSELRLAREVSHKNVVRIHDIGEHEGLRFLTMRYVPGRSLSDVLEKEGPMSPERAVAITRQVASALEEAHRAGVIHRDLKPGNILLDRDDTAYITDFGIARSLTRDGLTRAGAVVGTPDYLSPEQIAGDPVDGRTDLYALGIVLYEMLTGELPFRPGSQAEMLGQRLAGRARDVSETGVRAPAWLAIRRGGIPTPAPFWTTSTAGRSDVALPARSRSAPRSWSRRHWPSGSGRRSGSALPGRSRGGRRVLRRRRRRPERARRSQSCRSPTRRRIPALPGRAPESRRCWPPTFRRRESCGSSTRSESCATSRTCG
ncbi:MAG: hypothetical protein DMF54_01775 [Acidobacteria bacterium]|nr:MAG: hypothetical protein DMF54_01775 [Acidobacteriota bacterium]